MPQWPVTVRVADQHEPRDRPGARARCALTEAASASASGQIGPGSSEAPGESAGVPLKLGRWRSLSPGQAGTGTGAEGGGELRPGLGTSGSRD